MNVHVALLALGAALVAAPAAARVYSFTFASTGHGSASEQCPRFPIPLTSPCGTWEFPWYGTVLVEVSRPGDGFFSGADVVGVDLSDSRFTFGHPVRATGLPLSNGDPTFAGATATVLNGEVVGIHANCPLGNARLGIEGMTVTYGLFIRSPPCSETAAAELIPAIPEPSAALLLVVGLLGLASRRTVQRTARSEIQQPSVTSRPT